MSRCSWLRGSQALHRRWSRWLAGLALGVFAVAAVAAEPAAEILLLALRVNGLEQPRAVEALRIGQRVALPADTWSDLQLKTPDAPPLMYRAEPWQMLDAAGLNLRWRIDAPSQTLEIDAPASAFTGRRLAMNSGFVVAVPSEPMGGFVNYDLQWQRGSLGRGMREQNNASGLFELGGFGEIGALRSHALFRSHAGGTRWTRLDTHWTRDDPARMTSLRLGDSISQPGSWGRALRFAGVQWGSDFSLRPGFLSFPLPTLSGEATLPSTVELYVNNSRRLQGEVPAGAFDITDVPVVTGRGELRLVVRDLLGREQVVVQPYDASPQLLRTGLNAFSYELGVVREDYGVASARYGRVLAALTDRRGISDTYTREWRLELLGRTRAAGVAGTWLVPGAGVFNLAGVTSRAEAGVGGLLVARAERQTTQSSGSVQLRYGSRHFQQAGQAAPLPAAMSMATGAWARTPKLDVTATLGSSWGGSGVGFSFVQLASWQGPRQRLLAVNSSHALGHWGAVGVFAQRDIDNRRLAVSATLSIALGARSNASVTQTRQRGDGPARSQQSLQWQRQLPDSLGLGAQLNAELGPNAERYTAQLQWQGEHAGVSGGIARSAGGTDVRAGVNGGMAWLGSSAFFSRRIEGSFAVVEVGDYEGVPVLLEHKPAARTDARGRAFVSGLRGYEPNRITVDASALPFDAEVHALHTVLTPPARSGVLWRIPVKRTRAATFRLAGRDGRAVPPGSEFRVDGQARVFPVGLNGKAFASGLDFRSELQVQWPGGSCRAQLALPAGAEELPELGTLVCT